MQIQYSITCKLNQKWNNKTFNVNVKTKIIVEILEHAIVTIISI